MDHAKLQVKKSRNGDGNATSKMHFFTCVCKEVYNLWTGAKFCPQHAFEAYIIWRPLKKTMLIAIYLSSKCSFFSLKVWFLKNFVWWRKPDAECVFGRVPAIIVVNCYSWVDFFQASEFVGLWPLQGYLHCTWIKYNKHLKETLIK